MEITSITFNIKDVITIVLGIASLIGVYYALKREVDKLSTSMEALEKKQKEDHDFVTSNIKEKEEGLLERIKEIKEDQKKAHEKLEQKIDIIQDSVSKMSTSLSELAGYLKGRKEKE